MLSHSSQS